jgi:ABC-type uncharacterized transport system substrate-binding protein
MTVTIGRRELLVALGGAAAAWPLAARAQQPERTRRIAVLLQTAEGDPQARIEVAAFLRGLQELGWSEGRNLRIDTRWSGGDADRIRKNAAELVALAPEVVLAPGGTVVGALQQASRTVPIVFVNVTDPVAVMSQVCHNRGGTPPDLHLSNSGWAGNGWSCSKRSRRA